MVTGPLAEVDGGRRHHLVRRTHPGTRRWRRRDGGAVTDHRRTTIHDRTVSLYARPDDKHPIEVRCADRHAARRAAERIERTRDSKRLEPDTPLYAAFAAWAWWGTGHLDPTDSWPKYRSRMRTILTLTGGTTMAAADRDWYGRLHQECVNRGWTESQLKSLATVISAFATWCVDTPGRWSGPRPSGGSHSQLHRHYRALARTQHGSATTKIRPEHCPNISDADAFGAVLGEHAANRWGPEYACWSHAPRLQIVTGCRLMELPVLRADSFELGAAGDASVHVSAQYKDGRHAPGAPGAGPTKNKGERDARIWTSQAQWVRSRCEEAAERPGGLLVPLPPELATGTRQLQSLLSRAIEAHEYRWTSHDHRKAYISWNLATRDEGGYGYSPARIRHWVGHSTTELIERCYWVPTPGANDDNHQPGERPRR